jgi:hypothetical protein
VKVVIKGEGDRFCLDPVELPGMPYVGRGATIVEAFGNFLSLQRQKLGVVFEVDESGRELMVKQYGEETGNQLAKDIAG